MTIMVVFHVSSKFLVTNQEQRFLEMSLQHFCHLNEIICYFKHVSATAGAEETPD